MKSVRKIIFGKLYEIHWEGSFESVVEPSVALYPDGPKSASADVRIKIVKRLAHLTPLSINPKIHKSLTDGMCTIFGKVHACWKPCEDGALAITMAVPNSISLNFLRRAKSKEFPTPVEEFEQLLHELILVPSVYFSASTAPLHAAAVSIPSGNILIAGTGGVGKSSAILALRALKGAAFISDDISVVSSQGTVYGNMAWPKIYGYNCAGSAIGNEILKGRGLIDRVHFKVRNALNPDKVRRKIQPDRLYGSVVPSGVDVTRICYLFREDVPQMSLGSLSVDAAADMSVAVMESEYGIFHRHISWEEYSALARNSEPLLRMRDVRSRWRDIYRSAFSRAEVTKISIPLRIDHAQYQSEIVDLVARQ